jgi:Na+-driven multidrug efflux pump
VVFLIPAVLLMSHFWKLDGVFLTIPASDTLTFILAIVLLSPVINEFRKAAAQEQKEKTMSMTPEPRLDKTGSGGATR